MSEASVVEAGVGGEQAGGVGEQHEQVGADQVGDEGGEAVVVAEADLVVGDGVVLVDDRHDAEVEQAGEGAAGVQVLAAVHEVERGEQHLPGDEAVAAEARRRRRASAGSGPRPRPPAGWPRRGAGSPPSPSAGRPAAMAPERDEHHLVARAPAAPATSAHSLSMAGVVDLAVGRR